MIEILLVVSVVGGAFWFGRDIGREQGARDERRFWVQRIRERYLGR